MSLSSEYEYYTYEYESTNGTIELYETTNANYSNNNNIYNSVYNNNTPQHNQQIELQIYPSHHTIINENGSETEHMIQSKEREHKLEYIEYKLNKKENQIIVTGFDELPKNNHISHNYRNICLYYKYRNEYILNHRQQRYTIVLIPIYIIFILFCVHTFLSIDKRMNINNISYINNPIKVPFRKSYV
eukprot:525666_1